MKFAVSCPGQGFIRANLLRPYLKHKLTFQHVLEEIDESLGIQFSRQMTNNDEKWMLQTSNAQPAIMATTVVINTILRDVYRVDFFKGTPGSIPRPSAILGHSLGEYTALVLNKTLSLADGIKLVRLRGQLMEQLPSITTGYTMKVLLFRSSNFAAIKSQCDEAGITANVNSYQQIVVSGPETTIDKVLKSINTPKKLISRATSLPVQIPFHNRILQPINQELKQFLNSAAVSDPVVPLISNLTGNVSTKDESITNVINVNSKPVQWVESIETLQDMGIKTIVNLGPGSVLHGINEKFPVVNHLVDFENDTS